MPLIYYTINLAKKISIIDDVFVSSDCKKILNISKLYGAKTILRPKKFSGDYSSEIRAWKHAKNYLEKRNQNFEIFLSLPCTSPLRNKSDVINIIRSLKNKNDLVVGITKSKKNPNFNMVKQNTKSQKLSLIIKKSKKILNRQQAPVFYDLTTVGYCCYNSLVSLLNDSIWDVKSLKGVKIPPNRSIDIDSLFDFQLAEILHKNIKCKK